MIPETPYIIIDYDILKRNIKRMQDTANLNGCKLRPHTKTHKIPEIAQMQVDTGADGITTAKISEAEVMADYGLNNIFIAYPIIGEGKIRRVLDLNRRVKLIVGLDSDEGANALSEAALTNNQVIEVRIEIDTGLHRTGVPYDKAVDFAKRVSGLKGIHITGIYTFRGLIYKGNVTQDREKAGLEEGRLMVQLASDLRNEGLDIIDVSVGSTPTAAFAAMVPGVTEIRPGTYVFYDSMLVNAGVCEQKDCAAKVVSTVISCPDEHTAVIDGGNKTISTDSAQGVFPYFLKGYGKILQDQQLILGRLSEEHGIINVPESVSIDLNIGNTVEIIPNHICTTINLHDRVYFYKDGLPLREVLVAGRGKVY